MGVLTRRLLLCRVHLLGPHFWKLPLGVSDTTRNIREAPKAGRGSWIGSSPRSSGGKLRNWASRLPGAIECLKPFLFIEGPSCGVFIGGPPRYSPRLYSPSCSVYMGGSTPGGPPIYPPRLYSPYCRSPQIGPVSFGKSHVGAKSFGMYSQKWPVLKE